MTAKAIYVDEAWKLVTDAKLFALNTPLEGYNYLIVSAFMAPFIGPKTYVFGANRHGERLSAKTLRGSLNGTLSHREALMEACYEPVGEFSLDINRALTIIEFTINTTDDPKRRTILRSQLTKARQGHSQEAD